jgi:hypothetical protein
MKLKNVGTGENSKYRILIPRAIIEKVLHWGDSSELDYEIKTFGNELSLVVFKKES